MWNVEGKLQSYDQRFNSFELFKCKTRDDFKLLNSFIKYSKQDTLSLIKARPILQRL